MCLQNLRDLDVLFSYSEMPFLFFFKWPNLNTLNHSVNQEGQRKGMLLHLHCVPGLQVWKSIVFNYLPRGRHSLSLLHDISWKLSALPLIFNKMWIKRITANCFKTCWNLLFPCASSRDDTCSVKFCVWVVILKYHNGLLDANDNGAVAVDH